MRLMQFDEIEQLLPQVPRIAELRDSQPTGYVARAAIWMDLLEQALVVAGAPESARVDTLCGELVFARHTVARDAVETTPQSTRTRKLAIDTAFAMVTVRCDPALKQAAEVGGSDACPGLTDGAWLRSAGCHPL